MLKKLRDSNELPGFTELNQGSYIMYTGVEPLDKEYDIDVGLRFNVNKNDYESPMAVSYTHLVIEEGLEAQIISMYAKGMTVRDIVSHVQALYGIELSPASVSNICLLYTSRCV